MRRGARHHIFSAIALISAADVGRVVAADPGTLAMPMSHNENIQLPLHFAVPKNRPEMVALLLELGADPAATDGLGMPAALYASDPAVDRKVIETLADRSALGVFGALALGDEDKARHLMGDGESTGRGGADAGVLHLMARRGDARAVRWLLERGADPNAVWGHWDAEVTPLHLAAAQGQSTWYDCCCTPAPTRASATASTMVTPEVGPSTDGFHPPPTGGRSPQMLDELVNS